MLIATQSRVTVSASKHRTRISDPLLEAACSSPMVSRGVRVNSAARLAHGSMAESDATNNTEPQW
jgi:hypothetical protein